MEKTTTQRNLFVKIVVILLILSLVFTSTPVFAEGDNTVQQSLQGVEITLVLDGGKIGDSTRDKKITLADDNYSEISSNEPVRTGYEFKGWFTSPTGPNQIKETDKFSDKNETTLYARWKAISYKIYFKGQKGTVNIKSKAVTYGGEYGTLATAKRSGYGFLGWYTKKSGGTKITKTSIVKLKKNTNLYAKWGKKYKIYFDANRGKVSTKKKTVVKGSKYGTLPKPKRTGYTFLGWYTKKSKGSERSAATKVNITKNTKLYAQWKRTKYILKFDAKGGKSSLSKKGVYYKKKYGKLPSASRTGYTFKGWYTKGGNKVGSNSVYKLTKGRTLYAKWSAKKLTVNFDPNGGKVSKKSKIVTFNKSFGSLPKPTRSGYKFMGWYSNKSWEIKISSSTKVKSTKNTLYAKWEKAYTLKFNYNNGIKGKVTSKSLIFEEKYGSLPSAEKSGAKFLGWYTKKTGGEKVSSATTLSIKENRTIYAHWDQRLSISTMLAPSGSKCRSGLSMNFKGVTIHNTGNTSRTAGALNHAKYLQNGGRYNSASWHYCVDESAITQSIPESEVAWHAGDGRNGFGNRKTVAIEICMNKGANLTAATDNAAELTAFILWKRGIETAVSGKNLFQHNYHSGKNCPEMIRAGKPYNWSTFVKKVNSYLSLLNSD